MFLLIHKGIAKSQCLYVHIPTKPAAQRQYCNYVLLDVILSLIVSHHMICVGYLTVNGNGYGVITCNINQSCIHGPIGYGLCA